MEIAWQIKSGANISRANTALEFSPDFTPRLSPSTSRLTHYRFRRIALAGAPSCPSTFIGSTIRS